MSLEHEDHVSVCDVSMMCIDDGTDLQSTREVPSVNLPTRIDPTSQISFASMIPLIFASQNPPDGCYSVMNTSDIHLIGAIERLKRSNHIDESIFKVERHRQWIVIVVVLLRVKSEDERAVDGQSW